MAQLYWDDVTAGQELPPLVKQPTTQQLVMWAAVSGDFQTLHFDKDVAQARGFKAVVVPGYLTLAFLGQLVTDWIGVEGTLKKIFGSYRGMHHPGADIICRGKVTNKEVVEGEHRIELEIWAENSQGERTTPGSALVVLPTRCR